MTIYCAAKVTLPVIKRSKGHVCTSVRAEPLIPTCRGTGHLTVSWALSTCLSATTVDQNFLDSLALKWPTPALAPYRKSIAYEAGPDLVAFWGWQGRWSRPQSLRGKPIQETAQAAEH